MVLGRLFSWLGRVMCVNTVVKALVRSPPNIPCEPELVSQATPELVRTQRPGLVWFVSKEDKAPSYMLAILGRTQVSFLRGQFSEVTESGVGTRFTVVFATQLVTSEDRAQSMTPVEERYRYVLSSYLCFYYSRLNCGPWGE